MPDDNEPYLSAAATEADSGVTVDVDVSLNTEELADEIDELAYELMKAAERIRHI